MQSLSRSFEAAFTPLLRLVFGDPSSGEFRSYFIRQARIRKYLIPQKTKETVMAKHGVDYDSDNDSPYCQAYWQLIDLAQDHWQKSMKKGRFNLH
jgi:hypothetical protein